MAGNSVVSVNSWYVYFIITVLLLFVIGFFVWAGFMIKNYYSCVNTESAYCPQLYCETPSTSCQNYPYRIDENDNTVCAFYLLSLAAPIIEIGTGNGGGGG